MTEVIELRPKLPETMLKIGRAWFSRYFYRNYDIVTYGDHLVPQTGPVLLLSNHIGWLDGPLLVALAPRPPHSLVKSEAFEGKTAKMLNAVGQVSVLRNGTDANAMRTMRSALLRGQVVLVYPEGTRGQGMFRSIYGGAAYLAATTGAPIVPIALFGTRIKTEDREAKPEKGRRIEIHYGEPFAMPKLQSPINKNELEEFKEDLRTKLSDHVRRAQSISQVELPERIK